MVVVHHRLYTICVEHHLCVYNVKRLAVREDHIYVYVMNYFMY